MLLKGYGSCFTMQRKRQLQIAIITLRTLTSITNLLHYYRFYILVVSWRWIQSNNIMECEVLEMQTNIAASTKNTCGVFVIIILMFMLINCDVFNTNSLLNVADKHTIRENADIKTKQNITKTSYKVLRN